MNELFLNSKQFNDKNKLDELFLTYTDVKNDKIIKISQDLDDTKIILLDSVNKLFERGETIEELLVKTKELENYSFIFGNRTKELNKCCKLF